MRTPAWLTILPLFLLFFVPSVVADQDEVTCEMERDEELAEAWDSRETEISDAQVERDETLEDTDSTQEEREEAWTQYNETLMEVESDHQRDVGQAEEEYRLCLTTSYEDEFEEDEEGFEDRRSNVRFNKQEPGFVVPSSRPLHHHFLELIEFVDTDGDGAFDAREPVVDRHDLARSPDAVTGNTTRRVSYDLDNGWLHLDVRSAGEATKFDVIIEGYAFASAETRLAISSAIRVSDGVRFGQVHGAPAILAGGTGQVPYLSWVETVEVDERNELVRWSVFATLGADGGDAMVYWAYPQGQSITHDPMLGVTLVPIQQLLEVPAFIVAAMASLLLLVLGALWRRR